SSSDRSPKMLAELVERTVAMARAVPEDPFCGLADPSEIARGWPTLDMMDPVEPSAETLIERARAAEEAALAVEGITNSEGAEAGWGRSRIALAASNGFAGAYAGSSLGVSVSVIGGSGTQMERDYDFASAVYAADLRDPAEIGKSAAERLPNRRRALIDKGVLTTWLMDLRSARQLGLHSTGHAARGTASPPSPSATNIWVEPGAVTPTELMSDIKSGFFVTELMGMGV